MSTFGEPLEGATGPSEAEITNFIQLGRIYDVLLMLLVEQNPSAATDLMEIHKSGALMASAPAFSGVFVTDEVNSSATLADASVTDEVNEESDEPRS